MTRIASVVRVCATTPAAGGAVRVDRAFDRTRSLKALGQQARSTGVCALRVSVAWLAWNPRRRARDVRGPMCGRRAQRAAVARRGIGGPLGVMVTGVIVSVRRTRRVPLGPHREIGDSRVQPRVAARRVARTASACAKGSRECHCRKTGELYFHPCICVRKTCSSASERLFRLRATEARGRRVARRHIWAQAIWLVFVTHRPTPPVPPARPIRGPRKRGTAPEAEHGIRNVANDGSGVGHPQGRQVVVTERALTLRPNLPHAFTHPRRRRHGNESKGNP
jgi:hypothetical protein